MDDTSRRRNQQPDNQHRLGRIQDPQSPQPDEPADAATKAYVDSRHIGRGLLGQNSALGYLYPKNINDRIGLGTITPVTKMDIYGATGVTGFFNLESADVVTASPLLS